MKKPTIQGEVLPLKEPTTQGVLLPASVTIFGRTFDVLVPADVTITGKTVVQGAAEPELTFREKQVLNLARQGYSNKEIGAQLGIAERTAKFHRSELFQKFHVTDVLALVRKVGVLERKAAS